MEDTESDCLQVQLDEVHALHYIFFPATVICKGNIQDELFSDDMIPYDEYRDMLSLMTVRTKLYLYATPSWERCSEGLLQIGFRTSPHIGDYSSNLQMPQSFIDVTFPEAYPNVPPGIVIHMNMSLSNITREQLISKLKKVINETKEGGCIYNAAMCLDEFLNDVHATDYKLWDETTNEAIDIDHGDVTQEHSSVIAKATVSNTTKMSAISNEISSLYCDMNINLPNIAGNASILDLKKQRQLTPVSHSSSGNETSGVESDVYSPRFEIAQWSVQCVIQSPLWYETNRKAIADKTPEGSEQNTEQSDSYRKGEEIFWKDHTYGPQFMPYRIKESSQSSNTVGTESQTDTVDVIADNTSSSSSFFPRTGSDVSLPRRDKEGVYPLENEKMLSLRRSVATLESLVSTGALDRYSQDFRETGAIINNAYSSFVKAQHMLDKNYYMIRKYRLPAFCILNCKKEDFNAKDSISSFVLQRKQLLQNVISRVALLARLQHNSITRYYQCWVDKLYHEETASKLLAYADARLNGQTPTNRAEDGTIHNLLKYPAPSLLLERVREEGVNEFLLNEAVINRYMYIQMEHCEGISLDDVIQKEELYKNEKLIWTFIRHLLDVLAYLHSNKSYHQALSLKNIIVYSDTSVTGLKVCEFGITGLLRQMCHSDFFCGSSQCSCKIYRSEIRRQLYSCHPSTFGVGDFNEFLDPEDSVYNGQQEDMFAFGVLIFRMWHPPMEERALKETLTSIISKKSFPQYFVKSTPPIIVTTLIRLFSLEGRPTAMELLNETLVPPVMDRDLYKQYLRRLQNPSSEEAVDALGFLFKRGWQGDVTRLRSHIPIQAISLVSSVIEKLETFMRQRSVMIAPPAVLHPNTQLDRDDSILALSDDSTVLCLTRKLLSAMQKSYGVAAQNRHNISLKRFCVGEAFDGGSCKLSAVYTNSHMLDDHVSMIGLSKSIKHSRGGQDILTTEEMRIVAMEAESICTAVESLYNFVTCDHVCLALQFPPLVIDFIALVFNISVKTAHKIYTSIGSVDINQYTLSHLLDELGLPQNAKEETIQRIVNLLRRRSPLSHALYDIHSMVVSAFPACDEQFALLLARISDEISSIAGRSAIVIPNAVDGLCDSKLEHYLKRIKHMVELYKLLSALGQADSCNIDCIPSSTVEELCDGSIEFPSFSCYLGSGQTMELVMVGGVVIDEFKVIHVYFEYLIHSMSSLKEKGILLDDQLSNETSSDIDVVVTCQSTKLLPAACSITNRLIDAGLSCECRTLPLIHTDHFNERLKQFCCVKVRVHLQSRAGNVLEHSGIMSSPELSPFERLSDDEGNYLKETELSNTDSKQGQPRLKTDAASHSKKTDKSASLGEPETQVEGDATSKKAGVTTTTEHDDDYMFSNVSFHVELMRGTYKQPRKIDTGVALVRYVKSLITSDI